MNKGFNDYLSTLSKSRRDLACEAVQEYLKGESESVDKVQSAVSVYNICRDMALSDVEFADILLLNQKYRLIKRIRIGQGGLTDTSFDIRIILKHCILNNATQVCMVHNHPSGDISPSREDDALTERAKKACDIMRIRLADHVIIGDGAYYSYREQGKLNI